MADTLRQLMEAYPSDVGPHMNHAAKQLMVEASAILHNLSKTLPNVRYSTRNNTYGATVRFIEPESGKPGSFAFSVFLNQVIGNFQLPNLPPSFRRHSNPADVIPASVKDPEQVALHRTGFAIANLVLAEIDGALIKKDQIKAVVASIKSKYLSAARSTSGSSSKST